MVDTLLFAYDIIGSHMSGVLFEQNVIANTFQIGFVHGYCFQSHLNFSTRTKIYLYIEV